MNKFLTKEQFIAAKASNPYWADRWNYLGSVVEFLKTISIESSIELGSKELKLISDSLTMGIEDEPDILHDAREPFPFKDKQFDLFIALQVWEHLEFSQYDAFKEVMRTCNKALLSFPYLWDCPKDPSHHMIDTAKIAEWTCDVEPVKQWVCNARIFYYFEF